MVNLPNLNKFKLCHVLRQLEGTSDVVEDGKFTNERVQWRRQQVKLLCNVNPNHTLEENSQLAELLASHHDVFSLEKAEQGETGLVEFSIDTSDSTPKKQAVCRIPYAARQDIAKQLRQMQLDGVIQPSEFMG